MNCLTVVYVLVHVCDDALVAGFVVDPLPVVTGAALVVKHSYAIFLVFDPLAIVLVAI